MPNTHNSRHSNNDFDVVSLGFYQFKERDRGMNLYGQEALGINIASVVREKIRQLDRPVRVLDIGCGRGGMIHGLQEKFGDDVQGWGLDLHNYEGRAAIPFIQGSIEQGVRAEDFGGEFDLIFSAFVYMYIRDKMQALMNTAALLKSDGEAHIHLHSFLISVDREPELLKEYNASNERQRINELLSIIKGEGEKSPIRYVDEGKSAMTSIFTPSRFILDKQAAYVHLPQYVTSVQAPWKDQFCYSQYSTTGTN